jgi:iron complex outermembrane receptor protein
VPALVLVTFVARPAGAEQLGPGQLAEMSLEQLMEVQLISAASKRSQPAREAPSAVLVVSGDEIRRQGYRTLGDALRMLPGFYVTYDRNYSYVGVRGVGRPGDYNTRILLLVDGVRTNDNVYDGAYVAREFLLDPDVIERVEVSRGPGASVYGNNAFFAVVDVITKRGAGLGGPALSASTSSFGTHEGRLSVGHVLRDGSELGVSATLLDSAGQSLYFPELASPETQAGVVADADWERGHKLLASFAKAGFSLELIRSVRDRGIPTAPYGTLFGDPRAETHDSLTLLTSRYQASFGDSFDWSTRLSFGAYDYDGSYPYEPGSGQTSLYQDAARGRWWNAETTGTLEAGRHTLLFGAEFQWDVRQDQSGGYSGSPLDLDIQERATRSGFFAQDDVELTETLRLSLGARYDRYAAVAGQAHPRAALIATPDDRTVIRLLYGSAFRAPNEYEQHYYSAQTPSLKPERIRTLEGSVERSLGRNLRVAASLFSNDIDDLLTLTSTDSGDLLFENAGGITSRGGEVSVEAQFPKGVAGRVSYSHQRTRDADGMPLTNSPRHMLKANLGVPLPGGSTWASLDAQYVGPRRTLGGSTLGGFVLLNSTLYARRIGRHLEASASVYNILGTRYSDPGSEEHVQEAIPQDGRTFNLRIGWHF